MLIVLFRITMAKCGGINFVFPSKIMNYPFKKTVQVFEEFVVLQNCKN